MCPALRCAVVESPDSFATPPTSAVSWNGRILWISHSLRLPHMLCAFECVRLSGYSAILKGNLTVWKHTLTKMFLLAAECCPRWGGQDRKSCACLGPVYSLLDLLSLGVCSLCASLVMSGGEGQRIRAGEAFSSSCILLECPCRAPCRGWFITSLYAEFLPVYWKYFFLILCRAWYLITALLSLVLWFCCCLLFLFLDVLMYIYYVFSYGCSCKPPWMSCE